MNEKDKQDENVILNSNAMQSLNKDDESKINKIKLEIDLSDIAYSQKNINLLNEIYHSILSKVFGKKIIFIMLLFAYIAFYVISRLKIDNSTFEIIQNIATSLFNVFTLFFILMLAFFPTIMGIRKLAAKLIDKIIP